MEIPLTFTFESSDVQHGIVFANTKTKLSVPTIVIKIRSQPKCQFFSLNLPVDLDSNLPETDRNCFHKGVTRKKRIFLNH